MYLGFVRFVFKGDISKVLVGELVDSFVDVGFVVYKGEEVQVKVYSGSFVFDVGLLMGEIVVIGQIFLFVMVNEVGIICCIGLNVSFQQQFEGDLGM